MALAYCNSDVFRPRFAQKVSLLCAGTWMRHERAAPLRHVSALTSTATHSVQDSDGLQLCLQYTQPFCRVKPRTKTHKHLFNHISSVFVHQCFIHNVRGVQNMFVTRRARGAPCCLWDRAPRWEPFPLPIRLVRSVIVRRFG